MATSTEQAGADYCDLSNQSSTETSTSTQQESLIQIGSECLAPPQWQTHHPEFAGKEWKHVAKSRAKHPLFVKQMFIPFVVVKDGVKFKDGYKGVACAFCPQVYKDNCGKQSLELHLENAHVEQHKLLQQSTPETSVQQARNVANKKLSQPLLQFSKPYRRASHIQIEFETGLARTIASAGGSLPLNTFDREEFRKTIAVVDKQVVVPTSKTTSRHIAQISKNYRDFLREKLALCKSIAITADGWTARYATDQKSHIGVTVHTVKGDDNISTGLDIYPFPGRHTAVRLRWALFKCLQSHGILSCVNYITADNASNIQAAISYEWDSNLFKNFQQEVGASAEDMAAITNVFPLTSVRCYCHTLNLVIEAALAVPKDENGEQVDVRIDPPPYQVRMKALLKGVRSLASFFHKSSVPGEELARATTTACGRRLLLFGDVQHRWNHTLTMLMRFVRIHVPLQTAVATLRSKRIRIPAHIVSFMNDITEHVADATSLVRLLFLFYQQTNEASGQQYSTLNLIRQFLEEAYGATCPETDDTTLISQVKEKIRDNLLGRYLDSESTPFHVSHLHNIATALDPMDAANKFEFVWGGQSGPQYLREEGYQTSSASTAHVVVEPIPALSEAEYSKRVAQLVAEREVAFNKLTIMAQTVHDERSSSLTRRRRTTTNESQTIDLADDDQDTEEPPGVAHRVRRRDQRRMQLKMANCSLSSQQDVEITVEHQIECLQHSSTGGDDDLWSWWQKPSTRTKMPDLAIVADQILHIPASSVPSESMFSCAGNADRANGKAKTLTTLSLCGYQMRSLGSLPEELESEKVGE